MFHLAALVLVGCGSRGPTATEPRATGELKVALARPDYPEAYRLMPPAFRGNYSEDDFVRMMMGEVVVPRGEAPASSGAPAATPSMDTPREALQSFVAAYRERHWEAMLEMVPQRYREHLTAAQIERQFGAPSIQETMDDLAGGLDGPIEEHGDQARLRYGDGREVTLIREGGRWKVKDLD